MRKRKFILNWTGVILFTLLFIAFTKPSEGLIDIGGGSLPNPNYLSMPVYGDNNPRRNLGLSEVSSEGDKSGEGESGEGESGEGESGAQPPSEPPPEPPPLPPSDPIADFVEKLNLPELTLVDSATNTYRDSLGNTHQFAVNNNLLVHTIYAPIDIDANLYNVTQRLYMYDSGNTLPDLDDPNRDTSLWNKRVGNWALVRYRELKECKVSFSDEGIPTGFEDKTTEDNYTFPFVGEFTQRSILIVAGGEDSPEEDYSEDGDVQRLVRQLGISQHLSGNYYQKDSTFYHIVKDGSNIVVTTYSVDSGRMEEAINSFRREGLQTLSIMATVEKLTYTKDGSGNLRLTKIEAPTSQVSVQVGNNRITVVGVAFIKLRAEFDNEGLITKDGNGNSYEWIKDGGGNIVGCVVTRRDHQKDLYRFSGDISAARNNPEPLKGHSPFLSLNETSYKKLIEIVGNSALLFNENHFKHIRDNEWYFGDNLRDPTTRVVNAIFEINNSILTKYTYKKETPNQIVFGNWNSSISTFQETPITEAPFMAAINNLLNRRNQSPIPNITNLDITQLDLWDVNGAKRLVIKEGNKPIAFVHFRGPTDTPIQYTIEYTGYIQRDVQSNNEYLYICDPTGTSILTFGNYMTLKSGLGDIDFFKSFTFSPQSQSPDGKTTPAKLTVRKPDGTTVVFTADDNSQLTPSPPQVTLPSEAQKILGHLNLDLRNAEITKISDFIFVVKVDSDYYRIELPSGRTGDAKVYKFSPNDILRYDFTITMDIRGGATLNVTPKGGTPPTPVSVISGLASLASIIPSGYMEKLAKADEIKELTGGIIKFTFSTQPPINVTTSQLGIDLGTITDVELSAGNNWVITGTKGALRIYQDQDGTWKGVAALGTGPTDSNRELRFWENLQTDTTGIRVIGAASTNIWTTGTAAQIVAQLKYRQGEIITTRATGGNKWEVKRFVLSRTQLLGSNPGPNEYNTAEEVSFCTVEGSPDSSEVVITFGSHKITISARDWNAFLSSLEISTTSTLSEQITAFASRIYSLQMRGTTPHQLILFDGRVYNVYNLQRDPTRATNFVVMTGEEDSLTINAMVLGTIKGHIVDHWKQHRPNRPGRVWDTSDVKLSDLVFNTQAQTIETENYEGTDRGRYMMVFDRNNGNIIEAKVLTQAGKIFERLSGQLDMFDITLTWEDFRRKMFTDNRLNLPSDIPEALRNLFGINADQKAYMMEFPDGRGKKTLYIDSNGNIIIGIHTLVREWAVADTKVLLVQDFIAYYSWQQDGTATMRGVIREQIVREQDYSNFLAQVVGNRGTGVGEIVEGSVKLSNDGKLETYNYTLRYTSGTYSGLTHKYNWVYNRDGSRTLNLETTGVKGRWWTQFSEKRTEKKQGGSWKLKDTLEHTYGNGTDSVKMTYTIDNAGRATKCDIVEKIGGKEGRCTVTVLNGTGDLLKMTPGGGVQVEVKGTRVIGGEVVSLDYRGQRTVMELKDETARALKINPGHYIVDQYQGPDGKTHYVIYEIISYNDTDRDGQPDTYVAGKALVSTAALAARSGDAGAGPGGGGGGGGGPTGQNQIPPSQIATQDANKIGERIKEDLDSFVNSDYGDKVKALADKYGAMGERMEARAQALRTKEDARRYLLGRVLSRGKIKQALAILRNKNLSREEKIALLKKLGLSDKLIELLLNEDEEALIKEAQKMLLKDFGLSDEEIEEFFRSSDKKEYLRKKGLSDERIEAVMKITDIEKAQEAILGQEDILNEEDKALLEEIFAWLDEHKGFISDEEYAELREMLVDLGLSDEDIDELIGTNAEEFMQSELRKWALMDEKNILELARMLFFDEDLKLDKWTAEFIVKGDEFMVAQLLSKIRQAVKKYLEEYFGREVTDKEVDKATSRVVSQMTREEDAGGTFIFKPYQPTLPTGKEKDAKPEQEIKGLDEATIKKISDAILKAIFRGGLTLENVETVVNRILTEIIPKKERKDNEEGRRDNAGASNLSLRQNATRVLSSGTIVHHVGSGLRR